jgi:hypothetical protein
VGQEHGNRLQSVLVEQLVELVDHLDARVHDDALGTRFGRDDVAVGAESGSRESGDEHG